MSVKLLAGDLVSLKSPIDARICVVIKLIRTPYRGPEMLIADGHEGTNIRISADGCNVAVLMPVLEEVQFMRDADTQLSEILVNPRWYHHFTWMDKNYGLLAVPESIGPPIMDTDYTVEIISQQPQLDGK